MNTATFPSLDQLGTGASDAVRGHFDWVFRTFLGDSQASQAPEYLRYITGIPHPIGNMAILSRAAAPEQIVSIVEPLLVDAFPSAVVLMNSDRPEQRASVESAGFGFAETMPLMTVTPETLRPTELPSGYRFRELGLDSDEIWSEAVSTGYGLPIELGSLFGLRCAAEFCAPGTARHFAIEHEGELVATSMLYLHDGLAGMYCVATKPEHRGKGLGAHLTAEPLRLAWRDGYRVGLLQASEMGAPVYTRIGFQTHANMSLFVHMPDQ
jgi:GNAT superfamily N-acetyltransferase